PTWEAPELTVSVPSELMITVPVDGEPPPPCVHECAAMPMPWKTPGRISLALAGCHLASQPALAAPCSIKSLRPELLNGTLVSGLASRFRFLSRKSSGFIPIAYAARSISGSRASVLLGCSVQRNELYLKLLVITVMDC